MEKQTFTREELYQLVWKEPMLTLSKKYVISDTSLRNACIEMEIPIPRAGHWQKLKFEKDVFQPPLPSKYRGKQSIELTIRTGDAVKELSKRKQKQTAIKTELAEKLVVPERLSSADKVIVDARESLTRKNMYVNNGLVSTEHGLLDIMVSKENIPRALRFMDTLIKALRSRGHDLVLENGSTMAVIKGDKTKIKFREKTKQAPSTDKWRTFDLVASGSCYLKAESYSKEWKDGKQPLENQLAEIITALEELADKSIEKKAYWKEQNEIWEQKQRDLKELALRKENELKAFKEVLSQSSRWHKSNELRGYIEAVETKALAGNTMTETLSTWLRWLRDKADWYDPFVEKEDALLENIDRDTLSPKAPKTYSFQYPKQ